MSRSLHVFALNATHTFGSEVAQEMGLLLDKHEERNFEDGEHKTRPLVSVREGDVYVIQSLYEDDQDSVNDKLCKLLFFIGALKDSGASRVTAVIPYLCYARKDRKTKPRDPVTTRYVACLLEAVGTDRVVTIDVHNLQAFQNAFRCYTEHLEAQQLFVDYFSTLSMEGDWVVLSPDEGGVKRAEQFRQLLSVHTGKEIGFAFMEKQRSMGVVSGDTSVIGNVSGREVIILDDLISSGTTLARAASACTRMGASHVYAVATHGAFVGKANEVLKEKSLYRVVVANTIPPFRLSKELLKEKVIVLDAAPFFAEVIKRLHYGESIVELAES